MAQIGNVLPDFFNPLLYRQPLEDTLTRRSAKSKETGKPRFYSLLEKLSTGERQDTLEHIPVSEEIVTKLFDEVHSAGDALREKPFPDEIKRYKTAVRGFMSYIVENGFGVEGEMGLPRGQKPGFKGLRGSPESKERTLHTQIKVVDEKLEKLAADIMSGQLRQLDLLGRVEEINGLLINMLE
ncbi:MAG: DUF327 family protein [Spirochaetaceae bacterium]|nr:DUF327 family protein [Spirochaetaceae bacterium]